MKIHACSPAVRYRTGFPVASHSSAASFTRSANPPAGQRRVRPAANVIRQESGYLLEIALPGIPKDQVTVTVQEGFLTIRHKAEEGRETAGRFTRKEFDLTGFDRRFRLPDAIDTTAIEARFEGGILYLTLPERKPEVKPIDIR